MKHKKPTRKVRLPKLSRPSVPHAVTRRLRRQPEAANPLEQLSDLPRITNETVAEHREEVLSSARKYIYPLQHSRDRIIKVSATLFGAALVAFFVYCGLALYRFQSSSTFVYEVTRVVPFPVARAASSFVSYESYLFELRHLTHYYQTQQKVDFRTDSGKRRLVQLKKDSMAKVIQDAYVKQLAAENNISVSNREVSDEIALLKSENRLGSSDQMLSDVLSQFWGWTIDDFRRELKSELLAQKVASELDTAAHARASNALAELQSGTPFDAEAKKVSDDTDTKAAGGQYPAPISRTDHNVPPQVVAELFELSPGRVSGIIDTGYSLEIVKNLGTSGDKVQGAHIAFKLQPISTYTGPLESRHKPHRFISV